MTKWTLVSVSSIAMMQEATRALNSNAENRMQNPTTISVKKSIIYLLQPKEIHNRNSFKSTQLAGTGMHTYNFSIWKEEDPELEAS